MASRVLLMNPPSGLYRRDNRCQSRVEDQTVQIVFPPMELALLAAVARRAGAEARIEDLPARGASWEEAERIIHEYAPDYLLINPTTATISADLRILATARRTNLRCVTMGLGEHLVFNGEKIMQEEPALDIILPVESEGAFEEIVSGARPASVRGLIYRTDDGEIRKADNRHLLDDLDSLPFPARDLLDNSLYVSPETGNPLTVIQGNRGCPSRCIFCPAGTLYGYRVRFRSPENIVLEIRECVEHYGIREFLFNGDTFTINKDWVLRLCALIREGGLDIHWGCNSRVDTFDTERAEALKSAGCWVVAFGIESGVQEMLDRMKKNTRIEDAFRAVDAARRAGLRTHAFYIIGLPWETRETLAETLRFARRLDTDFFDFNIAYPLPGTEYYEIALREGLFEARDISEGSYARAAIRSHALSSEDLTRWRRNALLGMYMRPGYIIRTLRQALKQHGAFGNYMRAGWRRLISLLRF